MKPTFNLVDEPWIPCLVPPTGELRHLGLRDVLLRAAEIREIVDPAPPVTAALHRLLLAILHRNFGPRDAAAWAQLWRQGAWPCDTIEAYLARWRHRFDLFDPERPFYQTASIGFEYGTPATRLTHELVSSWNPLTLFDHTLDGTLSPAAAARYLVAHHIVAPGGAISLQRGEDPKRYKYAKAASLTKGAVVVVKGSTLFATLMLNLHEYSPEDEQPFAVSGDDLPAWEREGDIVVGERAPRGYLDLLTWQGRRIRLEPGVGCEGNLRVTRAVIMKGEQLPDDWDPRQSETMLAYRTIPKPRPGQDPIIPIGIQEERAVWRDSLALFQASGAEANRPKTLAWLADLLTAGVLDRTGVFPIDLYGVVTDRAVMRMWRHERLPLPLAYLAEDAAPLIEALRRALAAAEAAAVELRGSTRLFAQRFLEGVDEGDAARKPPAEAVSQLVSSLAPERAYWSVLDVPFRELIVRLPQDRTVDDDGRPSFGATELPAWAEVLRRAARAALAEAVRRVGGDRARALRAVAIAERDLARGLRKPLDQLIPQPEEVTA